MGDASRHSLYSIAEVTYGVTPATPSFAHVRSTGCTLALTKQGQQSEELHSHRQITDFRHGVKQTGGDVSLELSYGTFDAWLEALLGGAWTANVLKCGVARRSFSIMRDFSDLTDARYHLFTGQEPNSLSLSVTPEGMVAGSFGFVGQNLAIASSAPASSTFGNPSTTRVFDAFSGSIQEGGAGIAIVTAIDLSFENNIQPRFVVGSDLTIRPSIGRINVTGTATVYFETAALINKFINETISSIGFTLTDPVGNDYEILIPRISYTGGQPDVAGEGPITLAMPIQAMYDTSTATTLQITRIPA